MGLFDGIFVRKVNRGIIHPYWDVAEDQAKAKMPGALVDAFGKVALNPDVNEALLILIKRNHPDTVDNVFTHASINVLEEDILQMVRYLSKSEAYKTIGQNLVVIGTEVALTIADRCPLSDRSRLLTIVDSTPVFGSFFGLKGGHDEAKFFAEVCKSMETVEAIARLRASPTWNAIDHRDNHFVEWVDDRDKRLLAALS